MICRKYENGRKGALFPTFSHLLGNASVKVIVHRFSSIHRDTAEKIVIFGYRSYEFRMTAPPQPKEERHVMHRIPFSFLAIDPNLTSVLFSLHQAPPTALCPRCFIRF